MITFYSEDITLPAIDQAKVSDWIRRVAATYGKRTGDISYIFCSDEKILEVNRQYLQHDYYTDIITFDYTAGNKISGDLFISSTSAASTTRGRASGKSWKPTKTRRWRCGSKPTLTPLSTPSS